MSELNNAMLECRAGIMEHAFPNRKYRHLAYFANMLMKEVCHNWSEEDEPTLIKMIHMIEEVYFNTTDDTNEENRLTNFILSD